MKLFCSVRHKESTRILIESKGISRWLIIPLSNLNAVMGKDTIPFLHRSVSALAPCYIHAHWTVFYMQCWTFCQSIYNRKMYVFTLSLYEHWAAFHYSEDQSYVQGGNTDEYFIYLKSLYRLKKQNTYIFQVRWILRFHNSVFSLDSSCSQVYTGTDLRYDKFACIDSIFLFLCCCFYCMPLFFL